MILVINILSFTHHIAEGILDLKKVYLTEEWKNESQQAGKKTSLYLWTSRSPFSHWNTSLPFILLFRKQLKKERTKYIWVDRRYKFPRKVSRKKKKKRDKIKFRFHNFDSTILTFLLQRHSRSQCSLLEQNEFKICYMQNFMWNIIFYLLCSFEICP